MADNYLPTCGQRHVSSLLRIQPHTEWTPAVTEARPAGKSLSDWNWNLDRAALQRVT